MRPEIRLTPPRRARRRIAGFVIPKSQVSKGELAARCSRRTLNVVAQNLAVTLRAALAKALHPVSATDSQPLKRAASCSPFRPFHGQTLLIRVELVKVVDLKVADIASGAMRARGKSVGKLAAFRRLA